MLPNSTISHDRTQLASEYIFAFCLSITSWLIVANLWLRQGAIVQLHNQFHQFDFGVTLSWAWIVKVVISILPFVLDGILFSFWNIDNLLLTLSVFWAFIYEASFLWLMIVGAVPILWYVFLAELVHASLCVNNSTLAQEVAAGGGGHTATLTRIHMKNLTLQRFYREMEHVLSIPLLCSKIIITTTLITSGFFVLLELNTNSGNDSSLYPSFINIIPMLLKMLTIVMLGCTANRITEAVSYVYTVA